MKFLVDELPYYHSDCPFYDNCPDRDSDDCPREFDKYKVCDDNENPHECYYLKEVTWTERN